MGGTRGEEWARSRAAAGGGGGLIIRSGSGMAAGGKRAAREGRGRAYHWCRVAQEWHRSGTGVGKSHESAH